MKTSLGLLLILVTTMGQAFADTPESARQIAESATAEWNAAFAKGRVDDILTLYSNDAMLLQPDGAVSRGASQIRDFWQKMIQQGEYAMDVIDVRREQGGAIVATVRLSDVKTLTSAHQTVKYNYDGVVYSVLKQQADGRWKAEVQRWNSAHNT